MGKEDIRKTFDFGKIHFLLSDITSKDKGMFPPRNIFERQYGPNENIVHAFWSNREKGKQDESFLTIQAKTEIKIKDDDIRVEKIPDITEDKDCFIPFPGFSSMEDESNFIYPFLSKRKVIHYSGQGGRNTSFMVTEGLHNLPSRIQNLTNPSHPHHKRYVELCNNMLGFVVGKAPSTTTNEDRLGIFVKQSEMIYLESMGEGTANILGLLTILLTEDNKLFLIEELENDIHPAALKMLLSLIIEKSQNNQFVITTHSNIVLKYLASIQETKIFYTECFITESSNLGNINLPTSTISPIENTPEERLKVLEKLGYDLFDFDLYKSYILLEESSAEQIIRDFIIPDFFPDLKKKVKTIAAGGASDVPARFIDFLRLFVFIHNTPIYDKKAWVITDGDKAGVESLAKLKQKFPTWSDHFLNFSAHNFEEYYPEPFKSKFDKIKVIQDKQESRNCKFSLTKEVLKWIENDRVKARLAFKESAKEVIEILSKINAHLQK